MSKRIILSEQEKELMVQEYLKMRAHKQTVARFAAKYGITPARLYQILEEKGVPLND